MRNLIKRITAVILSIALLFISGGIIPTRTDAASISGSKFVSVREIDLFSNSYGIMWGEVFFEIDVTLAGMVGNDYRLHYAQDASKFTNTFMTQHNVAYCVEAIAADPSGNPNYSTLKLTQSEFSSTQQKRIANILKNGYPANKDYWYSKGVTSYFQQAYATQMAIWWVTNEMGVSSLVGSVPWSDYTAKTTTLLNMAKQLYQCGKSTSTTTVSASATVKGTSVQRSGDNIIYTWSVTASGCDWGTQLSFSTVPTGASVKVNGTAVILTNRSHSTTLNNRTYTVQMTVPASGNSGKTITLTATTDEPSGEPADFNYWKTTAKGYNGAGSYVKHQNMVGTTSKMTQKTKSASLTSTINGGRIQFNKYNESNAGISGATFGIYTNQACTSKATVYSDVGLQTVLSNGWRVEMENGTQLSGYLKPGTYYVKEIAAPPGYNVSSDVKSVVVSEDSTSTVSYINTPAPSGTLTIRKSGRSDYYGGTLVGVTFGLYTDIACTVPATVYKDAACTVILEDGYKATTVGGTRMDPKRGTASFGYLKPGIYYAKELDNPHNGYVIPEEPTMINITPVTTELTVDIKNESYKGVVYIYKWDDQTHEPLADAVFTLYEWNGTRYDEVGPLEWSDIDDLYYSDWLYYDDNINMGKFKVAETKAPDGYINDGWEYEFELTGDMQVFEFDLTNSKTREGIVSIHKTDELSGTDLSGADFVLYEWDGSDYIESGKLTESEKGIYTTTAVWTETNKGMFKVMEMSAPDGYINAGWEQEFVLTKNGQTFDYDVSNTPVKYRFRKFTEEGDPLAGCKFELRDSKDSIIDTWTTDENGNHEISGRLVIGETYTLTETAVPEGYKIADSVTFVAVEDTEWVVISITNERTKEGSITVVDEDREGNPLPGVRFALFSTQEEEETETFEFEGKVFHQIKEKDTNTDGEASFTELPADGETEYLIIEEKVTDGIILLKEPIYIGVLPQEGEEGPIYDVTVYVENYLRFLLPLTGATGINRWNTFIWILAGSSFTGILLLSNKKRKEIR